MKKTTQHPKFVKETLADALLTILSTSEYDKITIAEIAATANASRSTFYRHFKTKDELVAFKFDLISTAWQANHDPSAMVTYPQRVIAYLHFLNHHKQLLTLLKKSGQEKLIERYFRDLLVAPPKNTYDLYREVGLTSYFYGIINEWINRDFRESPEQLGAIMLAILTGERK